MLGISFEPIAVPKVEIDHTSNMTDGILFDRERRKLSATTMRLKSGYATYVQYVSVSKSKILENFEPSKYN